MSQASGRDYGLTGMEGSQAIEQGLAGAPWGFMVGRHPLRRICRDLRVVVGLALAGSPQYLIRARHSATSPNTPSKRDTP